jgi:hypothetical protein
LSGRVAAFVATGLFTEGEFSMNRTLTHVFWFDAPRQRRSAAGNAWRTTIVVAAALVIPNILAAAARADSAYSATLGASLTVTGFMDAEGNAISKPAGLTLTIFDAFSDDETFIIVEGDATANSDGAIDVIAGDPLDLVAGDRIDFDLAASGTTVYPSGISFAAAFGLVSILAENNSPDPVTVIFDFDYDYALNASVDDPALEYAYALVGFELDIEPEFFQGPEPEYIFLVENNASQTDMGAASLVVTLLAGQSEFVNAMAFAGGDPFAVPEPSGLALLTLAASALLLRSRHTICARISFYRTADEGIGAT